MVSGGTFTSFTGKNDGFDGENLLLFAGTCSHKNPLKDRSSKCG
jgi:hypothetical protein